MEPQAQGGHDLRASWVGVCADNVNLFGIGSCVLGIRTRSVHVAGQFVAQKLRGVAVSR